MKILKAFLSKIQVSDLINFSFSILGDTGKRIYFL